jgi:thioredoxin reductase (NADPH)
MGVATHQTDVAIVGAGPVGLFAVFECGMVKMKCHVIDALGDIGGQCSALYPEKPIYDIPGFPEIDAAGLIANLEKQAAPFKPVYHLGQQVTALEETGGGFRLTTSAGTVIEAKAVVLAAGVGAFGPNRPPLAGIEAYEGGAVQYLVRRRADYAGRRVVIAGGGDSAVDWAISLAEVAEKVYVVHRRDKFRAAPESVDRMRALAADGGKVELVIPYQLHGLDGDGTNLQGVVVRTLDGEERTLEADSLLPFFGLSTNLGPIAEWGFEMERKHIAVDPATSQTSRKGIFAVGDIATYPGKLKLILCGFSEAAMAAHAIYPLVHPDEALHFEYSTTSGVPGGA